LSSAPQQFVCFQIIERDTCVVLFCAYVQMSLQSCAVSSLFLLSESFLVACCGGTFISCISKSVCLFVHDTGWAWIAQPVFWLGCSLVDQGIVLWFMAGTSDLSPKCSDWLWCPRSLMFSGYRGLFSVVNTVARAWRWSHTFVVSTETTWPLYFIQIVWNGPHCMCSEY
jgi:hypothetical protein